MKSRSEKIEHLNRAARRAPLWSDNEKMYLLLGLTFALFPLIVAAAIVLGPPLMLMQMAFTLCGRPLKWLPGAQGLLGRKDCRDY